MYVPHVYWCCSLVGRCLVPVAEVLLAEASLQDVADDALGITATADRGAVGILDA